MSLSRAFTARRLRSGNDASHHADALKRSHTSRAPILPHQISDPIQLIHTTNMLSYNAPDIPHAPLSSSSRGRSDLDPDTPTTVLSTPPTSPEAAMEDDAHSPEPNHLTFFKNPAKSLVASESDPPAIPKRAPSHTKENSFDAIARSRSRSRSLSHSVSRSSQDSDTSSDSKAAHAFSRTASTSTRASTASHASHAYTLKQSLLPPPPPPPPPARADCYQPLPSSRSMHPFGKELAQVTELAEEYSAGSRLTTIDEEQQYLDARGLMKLTAHEYLDAVQRVSTIFFPS